MRAPRWPWALALSLLAARAEAAVIPTPGCSTVFQDDFESGSIASYEGMWGSRPTVSGTNPIAGRYSLASVFSAQNAIEKYVPPQSRLRLTMQYEMRSVRTNTSGSPVIFSFTSRSAGFDPAWLFVTSQTASPTGLTMGARAYRSASGFEDSPRWNLPTRGSVRVDWDRAASGTTGFVSVYLDGNLQWTSRATGDTSTTVDTILLGNTATNGTGTLVMDDLLVEVCPGIFLDAGAPPPPPDAAPVPRDGAAPPPDAAAADAPPAPTDAAVFGVNDAAADAAAADDRPPKLVITEPDAQGPGGSPDGGGVRAAAVNLDVGCACTVGRRTQGPGALALLALAALLRRRRAR